MKKFLYLVVGIMSIVILTFFAQTTYADSYRLIDEGVISLTVRFDNFETVNDVVQRNVAVSLYNKDGKKLGTSTLENHTNNIGSYSLDVEQYVTISENIEYLNSYYVEIQDLAFGDYTIVVTGDKHKTYYSDVLSVSDFNKHIEIGSGDSSFTYGDVNGDGVVDNLDASAIMEAMDSNDANYDLTNDGIVDILDLVFFEKNHYVDEGGYVIDTNVLDTANIIDDVVLDATITVEHPDGANALFYCNESAIVVGQESLISEEPITIPIPLSKTMEIEVISLESVVGIGGVQDVSFIVTYYDDFLNMNTTKEFLVHADEDDQLNRKLEVVLPEKLVVSNLAVRIDAVEEDVEFAAVRKISFAKEKPIVTPSGLSSTVSQVEIVSDDSSLEVSFRPLNNVDGYEVLVGLESGVYEQSYFIEEPYILIEGLENFVYHYVTVQAVYQDWVGPMINELQVVPSPEDRFGVVDDIQTTQGDRSVTIEWNDLSLASYYRVLAKRSSQSDDYYQEVAYRIEGNEVTIEGLWNDVPYTFAVQGCNDILDSIVSLSVEGVPVSDGYEIPTVPSLDRIDLDLVEEVSFINERNVFEPYDDLFDISYVVDSSYASYWTASPDSDDSGLRFTFSEAVTMDYIMWVPRLDGDWISYLEDCFVRVKTVQGSKYVTLDNTFIEILYDKHNEPYVLISFDKVEDIIGIEVGLYPNDSSDAMQMVSLSEIAFYYSNTFNEEIGSLFTDSSRIALNGALDVDGVQQLENRILDEERYVKQRDVLVSELELALRYEQGLSSPGVIIENLHVLDGSQDDLLMNDLVPLGILGRDDRDLLVYAAIPSGANVSLVATLNHTVDGGFVTQTYDLVDGRNVISLPSTASGGSMYYTYTGTSGVNVHVYQQTNSFYSSDVASVPVLDLMHYDTLSSSALSEVVRSYMVDVNTYVRSLDLSDGYHPGDFTDISLPSVMVSLKASDLMSVYSNIDTMVQSVVYIEELFSTLQYAAGLNNQSTREYIRYVDNGYGYYNYGSVIGTTSNELTTLFKGTLSSLFGNSNLVNVLGNKLDVIGYAGVTNKLYSLLASSHDGYYNTALVEPFNFEDVYDYLYGDAYLTTTIQQAMYWQLHIAYADVHTYDFFNEVNSILRSNQYSSLNQTDRIILAYSISANVNLKDYFSLWNMNLSNDGLAALNSLQLAQETRAIQFLTTAQRLYRLSGGTGVSGTYGLQSVVDTSDGLGRVWIWINHTFDQDDVLGMEIYRDGVFIDFIYDISYTDVIEASSFGDYRYDIVLVDCLGRRLATESFIQVSSGDFIEHISEH